MNQSAEKNVIQMPGMASVRKLIAGIEQAKWNLAAKYKLGLPERLFRVAVNEAEALAWETKYPQLFFPALAEEKIEAMSSWHARQESLFSNFALAV